LARFIYKMTTNKLETQDLLQGLNDCGSIQPTPYKTAIPMREICATIIEERFGDKLRGLYEKGKRYSAREICSFRDDRGEIWRFHIGIFEEKQYPIMRDFLAGKTPTHSSQRTGASRSADAER
jgi:hypothetical protein